jgi:signal transduction histidine kinase
VDRRDRAAEATARALQKERELNELRANLVSIASHEFRTPLATIGGAGDLMKRFGDRMTPAQRAECIRAIHTEVDNLTTMLDDVLLLGRAEAQLLEFKPSAVTMDDLCRSVLDRVRLGYPEHHFAYCYAGQRGAVEADTTLVGHALSNVLSNAAKYSPPDSIVTLSVMCSADRTICLVNDQGIGIPDEDKPLLFETFHRGRNVSTRPGSGLGLAIARQCIELHGGQIRVDSTEGVGTTVTFTVLHGAGPQVSANSTVGRPTPGQVEDSGPGRPPVRLALSRQATAPAAVHPLAAQSRPAPRP